MKALLSLLTISALFLTSLLAAETLNQAVTLADGTVIPTGSQVIQGEDGTVEYRDENGIILAQVTSTQTPEGGTRIVIIKRLPDGTYVRVVVEQGPGDVDISITGPTPVPPPIPVDIDDAEGVAGDPGTQGPGPTGAPIDSIGQTVI